MEFHRSNIGPGTYEIPKNLSQRKFAYSFFKEPKLIFRSNGIPGVGNYTPKNIDKSRYVIIGKSNKFKDYWEIKRNHRSPGPIYKYTLPSNNKAVIYNHI